MRGFVNDPAANYGLVVDSLLGSATTAGYRIRIDRFGGIVEEVPLASSATLHDPMFYGGKETSFPVLLQHVAQKRGPGTISVIVSDLVQSGSTGDQRALVEAFQAIARTRPEVLVLGFRSAFCGKYWIESRPVAKRTLELCLNGQGLEQSRPFYAILIADSRAELEEARRYLTADVQGFQEFDATRPGVPLVKIEFVPPDPGEPAVWTPWDEAQTLAGRESPRQLLSFFEAAPPPRGQAELELALLFPSDSKGEHTYPLRSLVDLRVQAEKLSWGSDGKPTAKDPRPVELPWRATFASSAEVPRKLRGIALTYTLPQPERLTWDAYLIQLLPGQANLRPPLWVDEWSTVDDSDPRAGNRTLRLDLFVKAMIRSIQENVPLSEHYLLLGRGER